MNDQSDRDVVVKGSAEEEQAIINYLQRQPDFFIRHARYIESMRVPHAVRGAVSLVEWQMSRQRTQISQLEHEIQRLVEQANANQQLFRQLMTLQTRLASAQSLQELLDRLRRWARELGLADAQVRLFDDKWQTTAPYDCVALGLSQRAFEPIRIQRLGRQQHYLGPLHGPELLLLLPQAIAVGSVAMSLMTHRGADVGVLLFISRDKQHYQAGMGTELLDLLSEILPPLLADWINRK